MPKKEKKHPASTAHQGPKEVMEKAIALAGELQEAPGIYYTKEFITNLKANMPKIPLVVNVSGGQYKDYV